HALRGGQPGHCGLRLRAVPAGLRRRTSAWGAAGGLARRPRLGPDLPPSYPLSDPPTDIRPVVARRAVQPVGQVPPGPDQLKDDTVASATRSRSAIKFIYIIHIICTIGRATPVTP